MTIPLAALLVYVTSLALQWRRGNVSVERPRLASREVHGADLDRGSSTIWDIANVIEAAGLAAGFFGLAGIERGAPWLASAGLVLLIVGLAIRWSAILTLGRFFVGIVTVQPGHRLVRHGLYRWIRHPAYTGTLVAHLGLGLAFTSWISLALSTVPFCFAVFYRVKVEEDALRQRFGEAFCNYEQESWRLIPGVF